MKNEKIKVYHLFDKGLGGFKSIFPQKCGRTARTGVRDERGGSFSVIDFATAKQVYKN